MVYTWQCEDHKRSGVDDMTLLTQVNESAIVENLKKRFMDDWIFTYIGPVLVSVNPFKPMKYFTQREIDMYQGAAQYENPPHVYALADNMYRNMTIDYENQCVIISGESGAGKTVAAKYIMNYLSQVSGGGATTQQVKDVILKSNPLLEAFGNAKTVRNNNSSRFGKYVEILFASGQPQGGQISNFLLEKSRVVMQNPQERNFHVFYQLCFGMDQETRTQYGIVEMDYFNYLNAHGCFKVEGTDDAAEFHDTIEAMATMGMDEVEQSEVIQLVSGILHLGNILFSEAGSDQAAVYLDDRLEYPSYLLQVDKELLRKKLTSRIMESKWGSTTETLDVTLNVQQADSTRDALAKGLYTRLFDYLVKRVNQAMAISSSQKTQSLLTLGILDIYGFEIFQKNGFEQFCINFVNEKLQQIFIELTLKAEQEEYVQEGIAWKSIDYFNNAIVCQLIEEKRPPGIMAILDDVCASQHGVKEGADLNLKAKLKDNCKNHQHFGDAANGFIIHHYAGVVTYDVDGFCERNRDIFYNDLIELMQTSQSNFIRGLFPETVDRSSKKRPVTSGAKIKSQANKLVESLMLCTPHYIRCIKPNETKKSRDWEQKRVEHQVEYLGLKENIRVRRAGFAYRRPFEKFLQRYALLTKETWPKWCGDVKKGVVHILKSVSMPQDEYQFGKTKLFIKAPESLFLLEETRERKIDHFARVIQKTFQRYFNKQKFMKQKEEAADLFFRKKERRAHSLNRKFFADYIGLDDKPALKNLVGRRDKIEFAQTVSRYDKKFKGVKHAMRDLIVTQKGIFLVGRQIEKSGPNKGQQIETVTRRIEFGSLYQVSLSTKQDDFIVLHVANSYDSLLQVPFKTELVTVLKRLKETCNGLLKLVFADKIEFVSDKSRLGSGKKRTLIFQNGLTQEETISSGGFLNNDLIVKVVPGMPNTSRPTKDVFQSGQKRQNTYQTQKNRPGPPTQTMTSDNSGGIRPVRSAPMKPPGPPTTPAPASQPRHRPSVKFNRSPSVRSQEQPPILSLKKQKDEMIYFRQQGLGQVIPSPNMNFLQTPAGGQARAVRQSYADRSPNPAPRARPVPAGGRPKPNVKSMSPRGKVLYDYSAGDTDEISLVEGEIIEITLEDDSGWWRGKNSKGQDGLFPGSYVQKLS